MPLNHIHTALKRCCRCWLSLKGRINKNIAVSATLDICCNESFDLKWGKGLKIDGIVIFQPEIRACISRRIPAFLCGDPQMCTFLHVAWKWPGSIAIHFHFFCLVISSLRDMGGADQNWVTWSVYCNSSSSHSSFQKDVMSFLVLAADRIKHMGRLKQSEVRFALLRRRQWRSNDTDKEYFCQLRLSVF